MGCHSLREGIFPTQGLNPGLLNCRQMLYCLSPKGTPFTIGPGFLPETSSPSITRPLLGTLVLGSGSTAMPSSGVWSPRGIRAGSHASRDLVSREHDQCMSPAGAAALIASSTEWSRFLRKCLWPSSRCFSVGLLPPGIELEAHS